MNIIPMEKKLKVKGNKASKEIDVLFEPEIYYSIIRKDIAEELGSILYYDEPKSINVLNKKVNSSGICALIINIQDFEIDDNFRIIENIKNAIIIGNSTLLKWKIKIIGNELDLTETRNIEFCI